MSTWNGRARPRPLSGVRMCRNRMAVQKAGKRNIILESIFCRLSGALGDVCTLMMTDIPAHSEMAKESKRDRRDESSSDNKLGDLVVLAQQNITDRA